MKSLYKIVDDQSKETLFQGTLKECETMLQYFLEHNYEAFLMEILT